MKFQDEYRDPAAAQKLRQAIHRVTTRPWTIMEICGGQTHTIVKYGIDELLPPQIELVHGPGCPVCVTPLELIDKAIGDRLPARGDLLLLRRHAPRAGQPPRPVCGQGRGRRRADRLFAAGLPEDRRAESRSGRWSSSRSGSRPPRPANAMAVWQAKRRGLNNFAVLVSHVLVPPAMTAILSSPAQPRAGVFWPPGTSAR